MSANKQVATTDNQEHVGPDTTGDNIHAKKVANYAWDGANWQRITQPGDATLSSQLDQTDVLEEIETAVQAIAQAKGVSADIRVTLLSGTVTTVSTVSNQTSIGGWTASSMVPATSNTTAILSNINNIAR